MERIVESLADFRVHVHHQSRIHRLSADADIVEVAFLEDLEIFLELGDHQRDQVSLSPIREELPRAPLANGLVLAFDDRTLVHADSNRDASFTARVDDAVDLVAIGDVPGIETNLVDPRFNRFQRSLVVEVDVRDDGNPCLVEDFRKGIGVLRLGDRHPDDVDARIGHAIDLGDAGIDVPRVAGRHGSHGHRGIAWMRTMPVWSFPSDIWRVGLRSFMCWIVAVKPNPSIS